MLSLSGDWINQYVVLTVLMSVRILGVFLAMPLFAFKALNMRLRVVISLMLAYFVTVSMPLCGCAGGVGWGGFHFDGGVRVGGWVAVWLGDACRLD